MIDADEVVLLGDTNDERFRWFKALLAEVYEIEAVRAKSFDDVIRFANDRSRTARAVFLTDDFPFSDTPNITTRDVSLNFGKLEVLLSYADPVCVVTKDVDPTFSVGVQKRPYHIHLRSSSPNKSDRKRVITELGSLGRRLARFMDPAELERLVHLTTWDADDRPLRRQLRSLSERHDLKHGLECLLRLIRKCLDCGGVNGIEVRRLGQGKSGAAVFHLIISRPEQAKEYVLKLCEARDLWKLESEVRGHLEARDATGLRGYREHVAALSPPVVSIKATVPKPEHQYIIEGGQWYAIYYDFLGGPGFGNFIDLETALTAAPSSLATKTERAIPAYMLTSTEPNRVLAHRLKIFADTLDGLCDILYAKGTARRRKVIWNAAAAEADQYIPLPPYQLTERAKGWVQDFLDSREAAVGARLFPRWDAHRKAVLRLVDDEGTSADLGALARSIPFTLSPVHGDLNANNVLLWLKYDKYPFLIDLPFYQNDGHALQDFARLEAEIKFALLDRQEESPPDELGAYDYGDTQVPLWIELEGRLNERRALDEAQLGRLRPDRRGWKKSGFKDNLTLCYRLIMLLRERACRVQQRALAGPRPAPFAVEYLPALLYHTIRPIGYPSLSVFKRLLAVHSAGLILQNLERILKGKV